MKLALLVNIRILFENTIYIIYVLRSKALNVRPITMNDSFIDKLTWKWLRIIVFTDLWVTRISMGISNYSFVRFWEPYTIKIIGVFNIFLFLFYYITCQCTLSIHVKRHFHLLFCVWYFSYYNIHENNILKSIKLLSFSYIRLYFSFFFVKYLSGI